MIRYFYDKEQWEDENDENFKVDMTPEVSEDCELEFNSQEEFWEWYNS